MKLTNKQIISKQIAIKQTLTQEIPKLEKLKLQQQYAELSKKLYIRTNNINQIKPYKKRKYTRMTERAKRIRRLLKEVNNSALTEMVTTL